MGVSEGHVPHASHNSQHHQTGSYPQLQLVSPLRPASVLAPGGYSVYNPSSPPPPELPTPFIDVQQPHCCCCKPQQQHPKQQQQSCASCKHFDHSTVCIGEPVKQPAYGGSSSWQQQQHASRKHCCECTPGWALYGLGWIFPICWVVAIVLPFFTKTRGDRRAAIASAVTLIAVVITIAVIVMAMFTLGTQH